MHAGVSAAVVAVFAFGAGAVSAQQCPAGSRNCLNLDLLPQISQQVGGDQRLDQPEKRATPATSTPYSGPIVGLSPTVRPTPTVGYRWRFE